MSQRHDPMAENRLADLLADRAVGALSESDATELRELLSQGGSDDDSLDLAAAAVDLALASGASDTLPESVKRRIIDCLNASGATAGRTESSSELPRLNPGRARLSPGGRLGWLVAAAASLALVVVVAMNANRAPRPGEVAPTEKDFATFKALTPGVQTAAWNDWDNPERAGVTGEVAWSEERQTGLMVFEGLPEGDPQREQYQLWIIDERGLGTRVSGAIFNARGDGATVVKIEPAIAIRGAAAFAVTIEQPGGVWVSDMSRRVVIASLAK